MFRPDDIVARLLRKPFEPFRIHMSDGSTYDVRHPDWARVTPRYVAIFAPLRDRPLPLIERIDYIGLMRIARLAPLEVTTAHKN